MNDEDFFKVNILDSTSLVEVKNYTITGLYQRPINNPIFVNYASPNDIKYASEWEHENFGYNLNEYGFRCGSLPNTIDIAVFGCSFTFGTGLPENRLYHQILGERLNVPVYNFGLPGVSIKSVVDNFLILSKHIKIKKSIFLFPIYQRTQITSYNDTKSDIFHISIMPNQNSILLKSYGYDSDHVFKALPETELLKNMRDSIYLLDKIAEERSVSTFYSSWDIDTYRKICLMKLKGKILPEWASKNYLHATTDLARDKSHPGFTHHQNFADKIIEFVR